MANWQAGDTAITIASSNSLSPPIPPTGWTAVGSGSVSTGGGGGSIAMRIAYRVLDGSETNGGVWGWYGSNPYIHTLIAIYRGADPEDPIGSFVNASSMGSPWTTYVWAPISPTEDADNWALAVAWHNWASPLTTPPADMINRTHGEGWQHALTIHDTNGGTAGWPGGQVVNPYGGDGGKQAFELRAEAGETISYIESFFTTGRGHGIVSSLPASDSLPSVSQAIIVG